jgi:hypothetical protein
VNWYDNPPPADNGTPGETLYNRPDRGLPPIAQIVDGLLAEVDARLDAIAARYGVPVKTRDPLLDRYEGEAA